MARMDSDMTEGNIWMHLLRFSVPMAIGLLFQQLYNTVDTLVVGQFVGKQAQASFIQLKIIVAPTYVRPVGNLYLL